MKKIIAITLTVLSLSTFSQTQDAVIEYFTKINDANNEFMPKMMEFTLASVSLNQEETSLLVMYNNVINEHKKTLETLENIEPVDWDENLLSMVISAYKLMGENLSMNKKEFEIIFGIEDFNNQAILDMLLITESLNEYLDKLNSKCTIAQTKFAEKHNIIIEKRPLNEKIDLINDRVKYNNELIKIYLPPTIKLEKFMTAYENNNSKEIKNSFLSASKSVDNAIIKLKTINQIDQSQILTGSVMNYLVNFESLLKEYYNSGSE